MIIISVLITGVLSFLLYKHEPTEHNKLYMYISIIVLLQIFLLIIAIVFLSKNLLSLPKHCNINNLPNVFIFYPGNDNDTLKKLNDINLAQGGTPTGGTASGEWSKNRYALLFMPGTYNVTFQVPYYVSIIGLGRSPEDVKFIGGPNVYDDVILKHGLDNFWRSGENFTVTPNNIPPPPPPGQTPLNSSMIWAVSQASPLRKVHINGDLTLFDNIHGDTHPMSSGGFMSDCKIDGNLTCGSQQQFLFRNCKINTSDTGVWNMVYLGCSNNPNANCTTTTLPYTKDQIKNPINVVVKQTPKIVDKPVIFFEGGKYKILYNNTILNNTTGVNWVSDNITLDLCDDCYVADPSSKASDINKYIDGGKHILFTPGIYNNLNGCIYVNKPNIILLGIGFPTLVSNSKDSCIIIGDVPNVTLCGILIQAGSNTDILCKWGNTLKYNGGGYIFDLFVRVGGPDTKNVNARVMLEINSNNVICDNLWLWRADHGIDPNYIGWYKNTCDNAIIVNGDNVKIYGLSAEHTQKVITTWNGNNGYNVFYQSEFPYDVPNDTNIIDNYEKNIVSYMVKGSNFEGHGMGAYSYFIDAPVIVDKAFSVKDDSKIDTVFTVFLYGKGSVGGITHVINDEGISVPIIFKNVPVQTTGVTPTPVTPIPGIFGESVPSYVCMYPIPPP